MKIGSTELKIAYCCMPEINTKYNIAIKIISQYAVIVKLDCQSLLIIYPFTVIIRLSWFCIVNL